MESKNLWPDRDFDTKWVRRSRAEEGAAAEEQKKTSFVKPGIY